MADTEYPPGETRTTAPQQAYTGRQAVIGLLVVAVGVVVAYLVPYLVSV